MKLSDMNNQVTTPPATKVHNNRSVITYLIAGIAGIGLIVFGVLIARVFTNYPTENRSDASTGTGTASVTISPATKTLSAGESSSIAISFDSGGKSISGVAVRLQYTAPLAGTTPALTASNLTALITQTDSSWSCPVKSIGVNGAMTTIDLGCLYQNTAGFTSSGSTALATFTITAGQSPTASPIIISFDPAATVITQKSNAQDVAAIPQGSARITIISTAPTATPTSTVTPTPTMTPTPTPVAGNPTATPTLATTATPTVTTNPTNTPTPGSSFTSSSTDGLKTCSQSCTTNRDCATDLSCAGGICRATRCPSDATCGCLSQTVPADDLPDSGSVGTTWTLVILGGLFIIGGTGLVLAKVT